MEKHLNLESILQLEQRKRAALINSLSGFKSLNLVGTINGQGQTNLAIFNSVFHLGAHPPLMGMIVRPDSVERHTLENILETQYYTLNHVNKDIYLHAHQTSARYSRSESEFDTSKLTPLYNHNFLAPFVKESHIRIGLKLVDRKDIELNNTILLIGEIKQLYFPRNCETTDGYLDIEKAGTIAGTGLDGYHLTQKINRLSYAKPTTIPSPIFSNYFE
jgi:flavin reductase (DIM6/NTAB) family NADH-FMN oxidoreductase RutF